MAITYNFSDILPWSKHLAYLAFWAIALVVCGVFFLRCWLLQLLAGKAPLQELRVHCTPAMKGLWLAAAGGICLSGFFLVKPDTEFFLYIGLKAMDQKAYAEAIPYYEKLIQWETRNVEVSNNLAVSYFQTGRYPEAILTFRRTSLMAPQLGFHCHLFCARAFLRSGNRSEAKKELENARALAPTPQEQAKITAELETWKDVAPIPPAPTP